ncbi:clostripain [Clostridium hydrogeniformans]|uniref:clostripain n=1 Tax=Clostridium hydrogeniformans TaxID=349933 RepID=UPI0004878982|nr:clostripain [Clostridium hydrogeniformans]
MLNKKKISLLISATLISSTLFNYIQAKAFPISQKDQKEIKAQKDSGKLTVMIYCDADNDLEPYLLNDIKEMKKGYVNNPNLNLLVLVDRNGTYSSDSSTFGQNFSDTRLYKIESNKTIRIDGGQEFPEITTKSNYEGNMGDPETLKKFIQFGKANYPADKYTLLMSNHGGGSREKNKLNEVNKAICWDESNNDDCLYMGEISDVLTNKESVDLLAFDACLMGTSEVAYQYRPGNGGFEAKYMVASSPNVWGYGFKYDNIFSRIKSGGGSNGETDLTLGGKEKYYDPATITPEELGAIMVEEQRDSTTRVNNQQLSLYDLSKVQSMKNSLDSLCESLSTNNEKDQVEALRGRGSNTSLIHYFKESDELEWISYPYFDIYDLAKQISLDKNFSEESKTLAKDLMTNIDNTILYSFGQSKFNGKSSFEEGKNGMSIFLPDGNKVYNNANTGNSTPHFKYQRWYHPLNTLERSLGIPYGNLSWCRDGQDPEINKVGNWFELLDSWFDENNNVSGGFNNYQW